MQNDFSIKEVEDNFTLQLIGPYSDQSLVIFNALTITRCNQVVIETCQHCRNDSFSELHEYLKVFTYTESNTTRITNINKKVINSHRILHVVKCCSTLTCMTSSLPQRNGFKVLALIEVKENLKENLSNVAKFSGNRFFKFHANDFISSLHYNCGRVFSIIDIEDLFKRGKELDEQDTDNYIISTIITDVIHLAEDNSKLCDEEHSFPACSSTQFILLFDSIVQINCFALQLDAFLASNDELIISYQVISSATESLQSVKQGLSIILLPISVYMETSINIFKLVAAITCVTSYQGYFQYIKLKKKMLQSVDKVTVITVSSLFGYSDMLVERDLNIKLYERIEERVKKLMKDQILTMELPLSKELKLVKKYLMYLSFGLKDQLKLDVEREIYRESSRVVIQTTICMPLKSTLREVFKASSTIIKPYNNQSTYDAALLADHQCIKHIVDKLRKLGDIDEVGKVTMFKLNESDWMSKILIQPNKDEVSPKSKNSIATTYLLTNPIANSSTNPIATTNSSTNPIATTNLSTNPIATTNLLTNTIATTNLLNNTIATTNSSTNTIVQNEQLNDAVGSTETCNDLIGSTKECNNAIGLNEDCNNEIGPAKICNNEFSLTEDCSNMIDLTDQFSIPIGSNEELNCYFLEIKNRCVTDGENIILGLLTKSDLPKIESFKLYSRYSAYEITPTFSYSLELSRDKYDVIQTFRNIIMDILDLGCEIWKAEKSLYLFSLLKEDGSIDWKRMTDVNNFFTKLNIYYQDDKLIGINEKVRFEDAVEASCNIMESYNAMASCDITSLNITSCDINEGDVILPKHLLETNRNLFLAKDITNILCKDDFPNQEMAHTYQEYFLSKYSVNTIESETMIEVKCVKHRINPTEFKEYKDSNESKNKTLLPTSLCLKCPINFVELEAFGIFPGIIYKIKEFTNAFTVRQKIIKHAENNKQRRSIITDQSSLTYPKSLLLFVEPLIAISAMEEMNYEILEFIGDSFLKYAITFQLYLCYPNASECILSKIKSKVVSNEQLYLLGKEKQLENYIFTERFTTSQTAHYLFTFTETPANSNDGEVKIPANSNTTEIKKPVISKKVIADVVESLIGTAFVNISEEFTIDVLSWVGINLSYMKDFKAIHRNHQNVLRDNDFQIDDLTYSTLIENVHTLENTVSYKFRNLFFYIEAFTHSSVSSKLNPYTLSNQRLEYLGDAILEIVITRVIVQKYLNSGQTDRSILSRVRSGLVNTYIFALVAVTMDLHKHLKIDCVKTVKAIKLFVDHVTKLQKNNVNLHSKLSFDAHIISNNSVYTEVPKDLADCFESFIGAVFVDCGGSIDAVWSLIQPYFEDIIDHYLEYAPHSTTEYLLQAFSPPWTFQCLSRCINGDYRWLVKNSTGDVTFTGYGSTTKLAKAHAGCQAIGHVALKTDDELLTDTDTVITKIQKSCVIS